MLFRIFHIFRTFWEPWTAIPNPTGCHRDLEKCEKCEKCRKTLCLQWKNAKKKFRACEKCEKTSFHWSCPARPLRDASPDVVFSHFSHPWNCFFAFFYCKNKVFLHFSHFSHFLEPLDCDSLSKMGATGIWKSEKNVEILKNRSLEGAWPYIYIYIYIYICLHWRVLVCYLIDSAVGASPPGFPKLVPTTSPSPPNSYPL